MPKLVLLIILVFFVHPENVALRRLSLQGPSRRYCVNDKCYSSSLVVDGVIGHDFFDTPCALVDPSRDGSDKAWWKVTLDQEYYIYRFALYNRNDAAQRRMNGFVLSVGRSSAPGFDYKDCYIDKETGDPPAILKGTCINNTPLKGDVIQVKQTTNQPLQMCELTVNVCAAGWYGEHCNRMCNTTTNCARCDVGQLSCTECVAGRWREHCTDTCHCLRDAGCNKTTGRCPREECSIGFKGDTCNQPCDPGEYGPDCLSKCGFCYAGRLTCINTYGSCPDKAYRCEKGYQGLTCQEECPNDKWDFDCSKTCGNCRGNCNKTSGICHLTADSLRCKPGYLDSDSYCIQECIAGKWGDGCVFNCSDNCVNSTCANDNGACRGSCRQGYIGSKCDQLQETTDPGSPIGGIIGGSVAGVIVVLIIVVAVVIFWKRRQQKEALSGESKEENAGSQISANQDGAEDQIDYEIPQPNPKTTAPDSAGPEDKTFQGHKNPIFNDYVTANVTSTSELDENVYDAIAQ